jgi:hypothetical protein
MFFTGGSFKTISNSIFWNNGIHTPIKILLGFGNFAPVVSNCNIQGGFEGTKIYVYTAPVPPID